MGRTGVSIDGPQVSDSTGEKHLQFRKFIETHLRIVNGCFHQYKGLHQEYLYFDLNAGPGRYEHENLTGSPIIFAEAAEKLAVNYRGWLFEGHQPTFETLARNIRSFHRTRGRFHLIKGDHRETVPQIEDLPVPRITGIPYGLIFSDQNGTSLQVDEIRFLLDRLPRNRIDVLAYVSAANYKRRNRAYERPEILDDLRAIGKRYIWLREPKAKHQWTFAILTDWPEFPSFFKWGFQLLGTEAGDALADRLMLTTKEQRERQRVADPFRPTGPTPSISDIPNSLQSAPRCSDGPTGDVSAVTRALQLSLTTFDIQSGEPSMSQTT